MPVFLSCKCIAVLEIGGLFPGPHWGVQVSGAGGLGQSMGGWGCQASVIACS